MIRLKVLLLLIQYTHACCDAISISGLTGRSDANGRYEAMGQTLNGRPVYDQIEGRVRHELVVLTEFSITERILYNNWYNYDLYSHFSIIRMLCCTNNPDVHKKADTNHNHFTQKHSNNGRFVRIFGLLLNDRTLFSRIRKTAHSETARE